MLSYTLVIIGSVFALLGIIFFVKGIGTKNASKIKFLGLEFESKGSSLIIFVVGAALIAFGAYNANNTNNTHDTNTTSNTSNTNNTADKSVTTTDKPSDNRKNPRRDSAAPLKEFTLTSGQQQVFNDLKVTFTLINKPWNEAERTVTIRIWRQITKPLSDTAYLDPAGGQPGTINQLFKVDNITPVSIPDVGDYKFLISGLEVRNGIVGSVQVSMFRN